MSLPQTKPLLLLVDDVPSNLHLLVAVLRSDYRIKTATNGRLALELATKDDEPELILLDVMMPEMSGIEVLNHLRANAKTRSIPVVFLSADGSEQSQLQGLELGADDYLVKPIVPTVLRVRIRSLIERKRTEARLRLAAHVFDHSAEAMLVTDRNRRVEEANAAFTALCGHDVTELRAMGVPAFYEDPSCSSPLEAIWGAVEERDSWRGEAWARHPCGEVRPVLLTVSVVRGESGQVDFYIFNVADIRAQKDEAEENLRIAHHDTLTGLPNRLHIETQFAQVVGEAMKRGEEIALLFLDLDQFKSVNDTFGHHTGDRLLVEAGRRLRALLRQEDMVARLGGDEFVVVLRGSRVAEPAVHLARRIVQSLSEPYSIDDHVVHNTVSVGVSSFPRDGNHFETLARSADLAMYHAKKSGQSNVQVFHVSMVQDNVSS